MGRANLCALAHAARFAAGTQVTMGYSQRCCFEVRITVIRGLVPEGLLELLCRCARRAQTILGVGGCVRSPKLLAGVAAAVLLGALIQPVGAAAQEPESRHVEVPTAEAPDALPDIPVPTVADPAPRPDRPAWPSAAVPEVPNVRFLDNHVPVTPRGFPISPADNATNVGLTPTLTGGAEGVRPVAGDPFLFAYTVCPFTPGSNLPISVGYSEISPGKCPNGVAPAATSGRRDRFGDLDRNSCRPRGGETRRHPIVKQAC